MIYFHHVTDGKDQTDSRVKIGRAYDSTKRLRQHRRSGLGAIINVSPMCAVRGKPSDETAVQRFFADVQWNGEKEIFHPAEQVIDYIRWLRDQWYAWVPDDEDCPSPEKLPVIDSSCWLPSPERRKCAPTQLGLFEEYGPLRLPPRTITSDDFYTNQRIVDAVREVFGGDIDLDPASHPVANRIVRAKRFLTIADNGLTQPWKGRVWLNPPFSQWSAWVPKVLAEWQSGRLSQMCVLAATRTLTAQYFAPLVATANAVCIMRGRIAFWGAHAGPSPDDGHVVFYFGQRRERFRECFSELGTTYTGT